MHYDFECEDCSSQFEIECTMDEIVGLKPPCPKCETSNTNRVWTPCNMFGPNKTLGSLAEKNTKAMSLDARDHLLLKQNEYRLKPFQGHLPDGAKRKEEK